ncbi:unnamed protein product [Phytophthora lilii]|uniref:Unnamed protein product n=1 Tax=Phytophthora lilii TaxID=2077276 RepID=A0A9W7CQ32_9STRA|nr:unnamed protein product [Phytophthora lilii]
MKGYICKITNQDESIVYVGSTTLSLERRWAKHTVAYKRWNESKVRCGAMIYHHFREHGIDAFAIHLVSEHEIEERKNLLQFEQLVIDSTNCVNKNAAMLTDDQKREYQQQYHMENKDQIAEQRQQYRAANKNKINVSNRRKIDCVCGASVSNRNMAAHRRSKKHQQYVSNQS